MPRNNNISGIYSITNTINGKIYYGSSVNCNRRIQEHIRTLKRNIHKNSHLQAAYNKYGQNIFKFEVVKELPVEQLLDTEQEYLNKAKEQPELYYNISYDAICPARGIKRSDKFKKQCRERCIGKKLSTETRNKMSLSAKGRIFSEEHKKKLSESNKGKNFGRKFSEDRRKSQSNLTMYKFKNTITNEEFVGTQFDFYSKYNLRQSSINRWINNNYKHYKDWILL